MAEVTVDRASLIRASEAIDDGDPDLAGAILSDLITATSSPPTLRCRSCPRLFDFPGQRDDHEQAAHPGETTR